MLVYKNSVPLTINDNDLLLYYTNTSCEPSVSIAMKGLGSNFIALADSPVLVKGNYVLSNIICSQCVQQLIIGVESIPAS